ncbi:SAV_2336 N-terminal domain-related protein [Streptomyces sp. NPDC008313]|uniref:SAV_2336 N-terminal domain-related protein n=1 Tax=Streptomyces sp. NPDC008313 TaxID=3364826 RepID=UPI0036EA46A4
MSSGAVGPGEPGEPWVARLHTVLHRAGADLSPREIGDALWLALHTTSSEGPPVEPQRHSALPPPPAPAPLPRRETPPPSPSEVRRPLYALTGGRGGGAPGAPVRVPAVRGLGHPLGVVRGLRALKRRVPSSHRHELDESATAEAIAETERLDAVLRPAGDRWLHLVLAVDGGPSMRVWRDTVRELADVLTGSGIFRSVRTSPLGAADSLTGGPTAVLAVTDGVGEPWYTGAARERLAALARRAPTAVLHLFPTRMWNGTGLPAEPMIVRTTGQARPNTLLGADAPWLPPLADLRPRLPVPVLELDEASLRPWAELIASHGGVAALRVVDAAPPSDSALLGPDGDAGDLGDSGDLGAPRGVVEGPATADERVRAFRATASPHAYELAGHLAAVDPLTLPVMRLVQAAALPDSGPVCLAEVLLSGLMHGEDPLADQDVFAFAPDVRGVLRTVINAGSAHRTLEAVNDFIVPRLGRTPDFPAVIAHRTGTLTLPRGGEPLAEFGPAEGPVRPGPLHNLPARRTTRWLPALEADVDWVEQALASGSRPVTLCGPAGSDKTTVALEYAHRHLNDYELVWWIDASTESTWERSFMSLAKALFGAISATEGVEARERAWRWLRDHQRWLLVIDRVTEALSVTWLEGRMQASRGQLLVTTRLNAWAWGPAPVLNLADARFTRCDPLTGLRDAETLCEQLSGLLCADPWAEDTVRHRHLRVPPEGTRAGGHQLAVLLCTLVGFETVVARYGRGAGDAVLVEVALRLRDAVRDDDTLARVGDNAFVVLAAGLDRTAAQMFSERLQTHIILPIQVDGRTVTVGAALGISWARCGMDADEVIESAGGQDVGQSRAMATVRLTDALCDLECMAEPQGRTMFATLLSEQLGVRVGLRGARQRADVVTLVRAALGVPDGSRALVDVVAVFEGHDAARKLTPFIVTMGALAVHGPEGGAVGRARPDISHMLQLTNALEGLECLQDTAGPAQFAGLLEELLDRRGWIVLRGARRREDVVTLVRAALITPGGVRALVDVVRVLEGARAGAEVERLVALGSGLPMPGVLSAAEEEAALTLLLDTASELPAARLRDALTGDLNGLDLPTGLTPDRLFAWVLQWNAQPDGLLPAVLLMERASRLVTSPDHRAALAGWAETWAANQGLTDALRRRRGMP